MDESEPGHALLEERARLSAQRDELRAALEEIQTELDEALSQIEARIVRIDALLEVGGGVESPSLLAKRLRQAR